LPGYSGTPLAKKLGIKEDAALYVVDAPCTALKRPGSGTGA
jgi:hypothetical protein